MNLTPCLNLAFDGRCEEAFRRYELCLNGRIEFMLRWQDSPMAKEVPPEWGGKINHATLVIGSTEILGSDMRPGTYEPPRGFSITLNMDDTSAAERVFNALAEGGTVLMPLQQTFWAHRFGVLVDPFGIRWDVNCGEPEVG